MNKTLTIGFVFPLVCISILAQPAYAATNLAEKTFLQTSCLNKITKEDMVILLKDANPLQLRQLSENAEARKKVAESIKELLATACEAVKEGIADDPNIKRELRNIKMTLTATIYDKKINGGKDSAPPLSNITEKQIIEFWNNKTHDADFQEFLDSKIALARESGKFPKDKELTEDEIKQAKDDYAKIRIYEAEAKAKELGEEFKRELEMQVKLQQSQFLASQYAEKRLVDKINISDGEIQNYIASHPELNPVRNKPKAEAILKRVRAGENFGKLAEAISEDPGTKGNGGLYKDVTLGKMIPAFESAALALEPGKIAGKIVETPYGYHIIKLEKKGETKGADGKQIKTYDVRHILIATTVKDPNNPAAREMPVSEMVKQKLEEEKQKQILNEIVANNPVEIVEDFVVPAVSDEQIRQQLQQNIDFADSTASASPLRQPMQPQTEKSQKVSVNQTLPAKIKTYLNRYYKGWKITQRECEDATSRGFVTGDFDGNKKPDFTVKFIKGKKGYVLAFLNTANGYKPFILHNYSADEAKYSILSVLKKGELFESENKKLLLKHDAPGDYRCESDVGGIHYYRNGKFVDY